MQKAEILAEIELFYLFPCQRRWKTWFPEVIHYYADADKVREEVQRLIKEDEWDTKEFTEMRNNLLKELKINYDPINNEAIMEKLKSHEKLLKENNNEVILEQLKSHEKLLKENNNEVILKKLKSYDEKLDKLEELEKLLKEIRAK
ncbi:uncharacterized protein OCT59_011753 [Rhizophagus irregularis]|uniref:Uncharacterized protein n=2 Tax=Rhizophagus irregularis TaxID=588596 RepID=A0A916ECL8_9GLOM|nr:hypothetical protein OCT59_011753 [Rhizophagus irregularis]CAB5377303.1 unnamed protein product [Rhizophagus irregularis]